MIRRSSLNDTDKIYSLYKEVARIPGGLARYEDEITVDYIENFIRNSLERGLSLVMEADGKIVGELHAYNSGLRIFSHVLSDLTICIHPDYQNKGYGRRLFSRFMKIVVDEIKEIKRVELMARESNERAINLYKSLGFKVEGAFRRKVNGELEKLENNIPMGWIRD